MCYCYRKKNEILESTLNFRHIFSDFTLRRQTIKVTFIKQKKQNAKKHSHLNLNYNLLASITLSKHIEFRQLTRFLKKI